MPSVEAVFIWGLEMNNNMSILIFYFFNTSLVSPKPSMCTDDVNHLDLILSALNYDCIRLHTSGLGLVNCTAQWEVSNTVTAVLGSIPVERGAILCEFVFQVAFSGFLPQSKDMQLIEN